jgi:hypothetical protein
MKSEMISWRFFICLLTWLIVILADAISDHWEPALKQLEVSKLERIGNSSNYDLLFFQHPLYYESSVQYLPIPAAEICTNMSPMDYFDCLQCVQSIQSQDFIDRSRFHEFQLVDVVFEDISSKFLLDIYSNSYLFSRNTTNLCVFGSPSIQFVRSLLQFISSKLFFSEKQVNYYFYVQQAMILEGKPTSFYYLMDSVKKIQQYFSKNLKTNFILLNHWKELVGEESHYSLSHCDIAHFKSPDIMDELVNSFSSSSSYLPIILETPFFSIPPIRRRITTPGTTENNNTISSTTVLWDVHGLAYDGLLHSSMTSDNDNESPFRSMSCGVKTFKWFKPMTSRPFTVSLGHLHHHAESDSSLPTTLSPRLFKKVHFFISFDVNFYVETAYGLQAALVRAGWSDGRGQVTIMGPFNATLYGELLRRNEEEQVPVIQIALGPHRPTLFTRDFLVFHTENTWDSFLNSAEDLERYKATLGRAKLVLVYSQSNIDFLRERLGLEEEKLMIIPIYSQSIYFKTEIISRKGSQNKEREQNEDNENGNSSNYNTVVTIGRSGELEEKEGDEEQQSQQQELLLLQNGTDQDDEDDNDCFLQHFERVTPPPVATPSPQVFSSSSWKPLNDRDEYETDLSTILSSSLPSLPRSDLILIGSDSHGRRKELIDNIVNHWMKRDGITFLARPFLPYSDLFDIYTREFYVVHTRVILNVHQFNDSILETHRINHLLSLGKVIVSERSFLDPALDQSYGQAVVFTNYEDIYETALEYIRNDTLRRDQEKRAFRKYLEIHRNVTRLKEGIEAMLGREEWFF